MFEVAFVCAFGLIGGVYSWRVSERMRRLEVVAAVVSDNVPENKWKAWVKRYYEGL